MLLKILAYAVCLSTAWKMSASIGAAIPIIGKHQVIQEEWKVDCLQCKAIHGGYEVHATYLKTSEQRRKVSHTGVGYPPHSVKLNTVTCYVRLTAKHPTNDEGQPHRGWVPPHSVKLNTVMCYARLTSKHPSNDARSATPGLGTPHTRSNSAPSPDSSGGHRIY